MPSTFPFEYPEALRDRPLGVSSRRSRPGPLLQQFLGTLSRGPMNTVNYLVALNQQLQQQVRYVTRMEPACRRRTRP